METTNNTQVNQAQVNPQVQVTQEAPAQATQQAGQPQVVYVQAAQAPSKPLVTKEQLVQFGKYALAFGLGGVCTVGLLAVLGKKHEEVVSRVVEQATPLLIDKGGQVISNTVTELSPEVVAAAKDLVATALTTG